jgi:hypothetical protein
MPPTGQLAIKLLREMRRNGFFNRGYWWYTALGRDSNIELWPRATQNAVWIAFPLNRTRLKKNVTSMRCVKSGRVGGRS